LAWVLYRRSATWGLPTLGAPVVRVMSLIAVEEGREAIRQEVLGLTSNLRNSVDLFEDGRPAELIFDELAAATASLARANASVGHSVLIRWSEMLDRISLLGRTLNHAAQPGVRELLASLVDIVGVVERSLDACLEGEPDSRFNRLDTSARGSVPHAWRLQRSNRHRLHPNRLSMTTRRSKESSSMHS